MTTLNRPAPQPRFSVGDYVKESLRPQVGASSHFARPRKGKVVAIYLRRDKRGARRYHFSVIWDGFKSPSEIAQHRLEKLENTRKSS